MRVRMEKLNISVPKGDNAVYWLLHTPLPPPANGKTASTGSASDEASEDASGEASTKSEFQNKLAIWKDKIKRSKEVIEPIKGTPKVMNVGRKSSSDEAASSDTKIVKTDKYEGEVKDGVPHGKGTYRFTDGGVYEGGKLRWFVGLFSALQDFFAKAILYIPA